MIARLAPGRTGRLLLAAVAGLLFCAPGCQEADEDGMVARSEPEFFTELRLLGESGLPSLDFRKGEPITFELKVTNLTSDARTITLPHSQRFDFTVSSPPGELLWRWSTGLLFAQAITHVEFEPRQTRTYVEVWNQTDDSGKVVESGSYEASGYVLCLDPGCVADPVRFQIR